MYTALATLHLLAALIWLGGLLFLGIVGAPVLRGLDRPLRAQLFQALGERFRAVGWVAIGVLVATGLVMIWRLGVFSAPASFWATAFGRSLILKWSVVATMLILSALHDFKFGPDARTSEHARRIAAHLGRANGALALVLAYLAVLVAHRGN